MTRRQTDDYLLICFHYGYSPEHHTSIYTILADLAIFSTIKYFWPISPHTWTDAIQHRFVVIHSNGLAVRGTPGQNHCPIYSIHCTVAELLFIFWQNEVITPFHHRILPTNHDSPHILIPSDLLRTWYKYTYICINLDVCHTYVDCSHPLHQGSIPGELGGLRALKLLALFQNKLTGEFLHGMLCRMLLI